MRFLRLRIANYRGVEAAEVEFRPTGITIVQGRNEAGKTSLGEAIGLLFEYPDSSRHRNVEAVKPVHRDEGPEIELQAESGPYAFTYVKRFLKKLQTTLTVAEPKPESCTGRQAHDRAEAILRETLDIDLWKALTIQQGDAIHQPDLTKQTSLSSALDKAAGGPPAEPSQEGLFDRVHREYLQYFTERGAERKELSEAGKAEADAQDGVGRFERAIGDLEQDIGRAAVLQDELVTLAERESKLGEAVESHKATLNEISELEGTLSEARLKLESAEKSEVAARRDKGERQGLIDALAEATQAHKAVAESGAVSPSALRQAEKDFRGAQAAFDDADRRRKEADVLAALRRADLDYYNNRLHLDQLGERKGRIDEARQNAAQAAEALKHNKVDEATLKAIRDAAQELLAAEAQLKAGAPGVVVQGLAECQLSIDDSEIRLCKGETRQFTVADRLRVTMPGALEIEITAGSSAGNLSSRAAGARKVFADACTEGGVSTLEEAVGAFEERRKAARLLEAKVQTEKENLRDLLYEELDRRLLGLQQAVPAYLAGRVSEPPIATGLDSAKMEKDCAEALLQKAVDEWEKANQSLEAARSVWDGLRAKHEKAQVRLELLGDGLKRAQQSLERARQTASDEALDHALKVATGVVASQHNLAKNAETLLAAKNPDKARTLAKTAEGSLKTARDRRNDAQTELTEVQTRLKIHGEEGLHEKLNAAQVDLERKALVNTGLRRRAAAAKCLYEAMRDERDRARRAYVAPLKEKIEQLGRLVFDASFQVEVSEELRIASRTAGGVTVPFDSLSGGTREQLSLIFRCACAMIVAGEGGAPLILDDTLGYTDPERLPLMGAILARAAKECQIVVLTCVPERYGNVGEAATVVLA